MKKLALACAAALILAGAIAQPARAQMAVVVTANTDPNNIYYRYQQFLNESKTALADYQQFQLAYQNLKKGRLSNLVDVVTPLAALQAEITKAMSNGQNPQLAAVLKRNQYLQQDLASISQLKAIVDNPGAGTAQMQQASMMLITSLLSQNMQQRTVDYAQAQDELRRANNLKAIEAANNASTVVP